MTSSVTSRTVAVVRSGSENGWSNEAEESLKNEVGGLVACDEERSAPRALLLDAQPFFVKHFNGGDLSQAVVNREGQAVHV